MRWFFMPLGWGLSSPASAQYVGINGSSCLYPSVEAAVSLVNDGDVIYVQEGIVLIDGEYTIDHDVTVTTGDINCAPGALLDPATLDGAGSTPPRLKGALRSS